MRFFFAFFLVVGCLFSKLTFGQEWNVTVPKTIIILQSTRDYKMALQTAKQASAKLGMKLDLEGNHPNKKIGLSLTKEDCDGSAFEYPCYQARGDGGAEDSEYLSIEYSDAYEGFAKGFYIVVAGLVKPGSPEEKKIMKQVRPAYKDAYAKRTKVWFGCMH